MAHYATRVASELSQQEAFDYMADFRNLILWDPGVSSVEQIAGDGPGPDAQYRVKVPTGPLVYKVLEFDAPNRIVLEAKTATLRSYDIIEVDVTDEGSSILYDATLELQGVLGLANPLLGLVFDRVGDNAANGLSKAIGSGAAVRV